MSKEMTDSSRLFIDSLGRNVKGVKFTESRPIFLSTIVDGFDLNLIVYLYNCLNPPGGRSIDEYKINLNVPGQKSGIKGNFDFSDGFTLLVGYVKLYDVFVLWDAYKHLNFAYNSNVQVKSDVILNSFLEPLSKTIRETNNGFETIICCKPHNLSKAIEERYRIYREELCNDKIPTCKRIMAKTEENLYLRIQIKKEIDENPRVTIPELSKKLGISFETVAWHISTLKKNNDISRMNIDNNKMESIKKEVEEVIREQPAATIEDIVNYTGYRADFIFDFINELIIDNDEVVELIRKQIMEVHDETVH